MRQWLQKLFARNASHARRHPRFRPALEPLGERLAPATFNVTNLNDSGDGSLRQAIVDANAQAGDDTITFQAGLTGTITLTSGHLGITGGLTVQGPGAAVLAVSGNRASRIFDIGDSVASPSMSVAISGLTLTAGQVSSTLNDPAAGFGGAIRNRENLTLTNCSLTENSATEGGALYIVGGTTTLTNCTLSGNLAANGGALYNGATAILADCHLTVNTAALNGGGFYNAGKGTLTNCTLSGNSAHRNGGGCYFRSFTGALANCTLSGNSAPNGGGVYIEGTATLSNCTLSGNSATSQGGGLFNFGTATLTNCTLSGNSAPNGGGLTNASVATMNNTIVANSLSGGDFRTLGTHSTLSGSHNLIEDGSGGLADTVSGDPHLGPLQDNGGPTWTHALLADSPARDAGSNTLAVDPTGSPLAFDQRGTGFARVDGGTVDIGAFEGVLQPPPPPPPPPSPPPSSSTAPRLAFRLVRKPTRTLLRATDEQTGETRFIRLAFGALAVKVRLAVADFNGDGVLDALVRARVGGVVRKKVFSGLDGARLR